MLKALVILSTTTVKRSPGEWEDLKSFRKSEKWPNVPRWPRSVLFSIFTKIFSVTDLSTTLLNRSTEPNKSLKQSGKQDSLKSIENVSWFVWKSGFTVQNYHWNKTIAWHLMNSYDLYRLRSCKGYNSFWDRF